MYQGNRDGISMPIAAELISPGNHPCGPATVADGDAEGPQTPTDCRTLNDNLWILDLPSGDIGYARVIGTVTVTVTGPPEMSTQLYHAMQNAHQASDTELWARIPRGPYSLVDSLLI